MSNHITASVEFYFKGERHSASIELDMDQHMHASGELPDLFPLLAQSMNIGAYSYEYEMMLAETIMFSDAKGLIADFVSEGILDLAAFNIAWSESHIIEKLQDIAKQHLSIDDINQETDLKNALIAAYQLGKKD
ncbi:MAG: hypothetical protein GQ549_01375 [Gammaproteobacteria bacterium]|nr:hypothetical protein [Gammaproteobacteria bacterium]